MNGARRKVIKECKTSIEMVIDNLNDVKDEEQEAYDNLPESFQYAERGEQMLEYIDILDGIIDTIDSAMTDLDDLLL